MSTPGYSGRRAADLQAADILYTLGQIDSRLTAIEAGVTEAKCGVLAVSERLDSHTSRVARGGSLYGAMAAVGVGLIVEFVKRGIPTPG
jgi:hypothetical protein